MKRYIGPALLATVATALVASFESSVVAQSVSAQSANMPAIVDVLGGTATFDVATNVPAINVRGKSSNLRGRAQIRHAGDEITIGQIEAALPVKSLTTGMGLRDAHMRKYVFTTDDGQLPDVKFIADQASCSPATDGKATCQVTGQLTIRDTSRPFTIALKVKAVVNGYRAAGDGTVKLSTYGIPLPSELGVTTSDEVILHLEFTARPSTGPDATHSAGD